MAFVRTDGASHTDASVVHPPLRRAIRAPLRAGLIAVTLVLASACDDDPAPTPADVDLDAADVNDAGTDAPAPEPDAPVDVIPPPEDADADVDAPDVDDRPILCRACVDDEGCPGDANRCLMFPDGRQWCGIDCTLAACPEGTFCAPLNDELGSRQCVPDDLLCENPCDGVACGGGFVCDPALEGRCVPPRGFCDDCTLDAQCGAGNRCLRLSDLEFSAQCMRDCSDGTPCPPGAFCASFSVGDDLVQQCVPDELTCEDRCLGRDCPAGTFCDPRVGACEAARRPCATCERDLQCGGAEDLCVALPGPPCVADADCGADAFCQEGTCLEPRCGTDCTDDPFACADGSACFALGDGRSQCLPRRLTCSTRCDGVVCGEGQNCDDQTGRCVVSRFTACETGCQRDADCGGRDDVCVRIDEGLPVCLLGCGDGVAPCPFGYDCVTLTGLQDVCLPATFGEPCAACRDVSCAPGTYCDPWNGTCNPRPDACVSTADCPADHFCDVFGGRCEPYGRPCDWDTRFSVCDFFETVCTAARPGESGTCEPRCTSAATCTDTRPFCARFHGTSAAYCAATSPEASERCGINALANEPIGQPCRVVDDPVDPRICPAAGAGRCHVPDPARAPDEGYCTRTCDSDADCGDSARCALQAGARVCVPDACACTLPGGEDAFARWVEAILRAGGEDACGLGADIARRRAILGAARAERRLTAPGVQDAVANPARTGALAALVEPLAAATSGRERLDAALALVADRWTVPYRTRVDDAEPGPLADALADLWDAAGAPPAGLSDAQGAAATLDARVAAVVAGALEGLLGIEATLRAPGGDAVAWTQVGDPAAWMDDLLRPGLAGPLSEPARWTSVWTPSFREAVLGAAATLVAVAERAHAAAVALPGDAWPATAMVIGTPWGEVRVGTRDNDVHRITGALLLAIDPAGNDQWVGSVGATTGGARASLTIDLGGDDLFVYEGQGPLDAEGRVPDDGAGRYNAERGEDGETSRSRVARHGAAWGGVAMLWAAGDGDDTFRTLRGGIAAGVFGVGIVRDDAGAALVEAESFACGAGLFGAGILLLPDGASSVRCRSRSAGFGGPGGVGVLVGGPAGDTYEAVDPDGERLHRDRVCLGPVDGTLGYGAGAGVEAPFDAVDVPMAGGTGVLFDRGGDDTYRVGAGALGVGVAGGLGFLADASGNDTVDARECVGGVGVRGGVGLVEDRAGADTWGSAEAPLVRSLGYGEDFGVGVVVDHAGDDRWVGGLFSLGTGLVNGAGIFVDRTGVDRYEVEPGVDALGFAALTVEGREPESNPRRSAGSWGLFGDLEGADVYAADASRGGDDRMWRQRSPSEVGLPVVGIGWDEDGW